MEACRWTGWHRFDGWGSKCVDLCFADDNLIFARSRHELGRLIDSLMIYWEQVGLLLKAEKSAVLTNEAQTPSFLATDSGLTLTIFGQKWLGCMLTAAGTQLQHIDLESHLQQPALKGQHDITLVSLLLRSG